MFADLTKIVRFAARESTFATEDTCHLRPRADLPNDSWMACPGDELFSIGRRIQLDGLLCSVAVAVIIAREMAVLVSTVDFPIAKTDRWDAPF